MTQEFGSVNAVTTHASQKRAFVHILIVTGETEEGRAAETLLKEKLRVPVFIRDGSPTDDPRHLRPHLIAPEGECFGLEEIARYLEHYGEEWLLESGAITRRRPWSKPDTSEQ